MHGCIITGIDTEVGKTVASAIVATALEAEYWKPIQIGEQSDRVWIESFGIHAHPETIHLNEALSDTRIPFLILPKTQNFLVIEGCGGVLCPFGQHAKLLDTFAKWNLPWIVVSMHYLGSLNHTQLAVEALQNRNQHILGLLFNGPIAPLNERWLSKELNVPSLGKIDHESHFDKGVIQWYASKLRPQLLKTLKQFGTHLSNAPKAVHLSQL